MDQECTLATHGPVPDQGQGPDPVLAALRDAEVEGEGEAGGCLRSTKKKTTFLLQ